MNKLIPLAGAALLAFSAAAFAADDVDENNPTPAPQGAEEPARGEKADSPDTADMTEPRVEGDQAPGKAVEPESSEKAQEPDSTTATTESTEESNTKVPAANNTEEPTE